LFIQVHDNGFTLSGGGRIYFSTGGEIGDPLAYWQTPLLDKVFSYDIDVSNVGCHCNAATYFSKMPVYNSDQELDPTPGFNNFWALYKIVSMRDLCF